VTSLIEQSSKQFLENKILSQMDQNGVDLSQNRLRDNILISLKDENAFLQDNQSAISELDEDEEEDGLDLPVDIEQNSLRQSLRFANEHYFMLSHSASVQGPLIKPH